MSNVGFPPPPGNKDIAPPLMGLYLDRPAYRVDPRGFSACNNVRIEQGRVHSDLLGWEQGAITTLPSPVLHLSDFIDSFGNGTEIGVTATDIFILRPGGVNTYITPTVNLGNVAVTNGSAAVVGTGTRWNSDIQFGDTTTASNTFAAGETTITVAAPNLIGSYWGCTITNQTAPGSINPGTYILSFGKDGSGNSYIVLSQPCIAPITSGDTLLFGGNSGLRKNLRPGDQIYFGSGGQDSISATWYTVESVTDDTHLTLTAVYAGATAVGVFYTGRQLLTNTTTGPNPRVPVCFSTNFPAADGYNQSAGQSTGGDMWFFTNGVDPIVVYCPRGYPLANYARSIPFLASSFRSSRGLMIYGGLTYPTSPVSLGNSIASSDNGFPLQLAGGVSFQGIATDGPFHVTRISQLGQQLLLYCTGPLSGNMNSPDDMSGAVVSASFVGFPTIWAFADVIHTRGPISGTLVAEFPDRHQFLAVDGEYRYNGLFTQIMNDQVWRVVLANYDTTKPGSAFVAISFEFGDLIWALPLKTDAADQLHPSTAYVEHYMEQANSYLFKPMTQRDFPFTCAALFQNSGVTTWLSFDGTTEPTWNLVNSSWISWNFRGNTPVLVAGGIDGDIYNLYQTDTQEGTPALATCTWGGRVIGNARARALVKRVYPEIEYINDPASRVSVTLTMQDALGGPTTITDTQTFNPDYSGNRFTTHYRRGRVATVTISDNQGLGWICDGYDFDWVNGGLR